MITPAACLMVVSAVLTIAGYALWAAGRARRSRKLVGVLAFVTLVAAIVLHDLEVSDVASRAERSDPTTWSRPDADGAGS